MSVLITREPGGTFNAERIRKIILKDYFNQKVKDKFGKYTDTLLYLAARNEHVQKKILPSLKKKQIIICDRFIDSTMAYQVYGKGVNKNFVELIHKHILGNIKPNLTFILKVNISKAMNRIKKRGKKNRYDKFSRSFYSKAQNAFIKIGKKDKKKYFIIDNTNDSPDTEKLILKKTLTRLI